MIEINLLPGARKSKRSRTATVDVRALFGEVLAKVRDPYLIGAIAGVAIGVLATAGMWLYQGRQLSALEQREQVALQDSTTFAAVIAQRNAAEAARDSIQRQIFVIKAIDGSRYVWPHIMDEVSRALPPYTWLKSIKQTSAVSNLSPEVEAEVVAGGVGPGGKPKSKLAAQADSAALAAATTLSFRIVGQTVDYQALTRFMKQLEASPWIERVNLTKTELVMAQPTNKEATEFTLDMQLQKPDSAAVRRVPINVVR
ncbi:MAG: PilN domain-containing protein [Gemmatimonadetes bacterium]|nr:PilN domain-containing protein [Gemmatimonadota bacterium]MBI3567631.1 PilN domain-containing protein [Gemmatimonadota bacterium]